MGSSFLISNVTHLKFLFAVIIFCPAKEIGKGKKFLILVLFKKMI